MHTFAARSVLPAREPRVPGASRGARLGEDPRARVHRRHGGQEEAKREEPSQGERGRIRPGARRAPAAPALSAAPAQRRRRRPRRAPAAPAGRARDNEIDWAEIERNNEQARAAMGAPSTPAPAGDGLLEKAFGADALSSPWTGAYPRLSTQSRHVRLLHRRAHRDLHRKVLHHPAARTTSATECRSPSPHWSSRGPWRR